MQQHKATDLTPAAGDGVTITVAAQSGNGETRFYLTDHVQSVKLVVDGDGLLIKSFDNVRHSAQRCFVRFA